MNSEDPVALVATFEDDFDEYTTTKNAVGKNATSTIVSQRAIPTVTVDAIFQYLVTSMDESSYCFMLLNCIYSCCKYGSRMRENESSKYFHSDLEKSCYTKYSLFLFS